jgi:uncharacterized protein
MVTASHLYQHLSCPRWPWNEWFGDASEKRGPTAFLRKLLDDGVQHEEAVYAGLRPARVPYVSGDHAAGLAETLRLLQAGAPLIAQAVLRSGDRMGIVDLLERRPGASALGDFHYEPIEIKTARSVKTAYRLQLAYYAHLLSEVQGIWPERAHVILHDGARESFALEDVRGTYERVLADLVRAASGVEPTIHICSACSECPWDSACLKRAEERNDVSLTYGLHRRAASGLRAQGIDTLEALAELEPADVAAWTGSTLHVAKRLVSQARVLVSGQPAWLGAVGLPETDTEFFFDIEGDPEHEVMYLFGVLVRSGENEEYRSFVAEEPKGEARAFAQLLECLESSPGAVIYHYHHYERSALRQLAEKHGLEPSRVPKLLERMRDLHGELSAAAVLPVYSYSLKAVARFLGYRWGDRDASAAQSMYWYSTWLKTGDRALLDRAVAYNADDCRATRVLKDWLASGPNGTTASLVAAGGGQVGPRGRALRS